MPHIAALHRGLQCLLFSEVFFFFKSKDIIQSRVIPNYSFLQTVKTKMKCCTMQHPIMVHTVYGPPRQHISQSMVHTEVTPTMTNSEDPDEVSHNAASHQGPHNLLSNKLKTIPEYKVHSEVTIIALLTNSGEKKKY